MFKISPLTAGILYSLIGCLFIFLAINSVSKEGWTFFTGLIVAFATMNIGSGIRFIAFHFKWKKNMKK